MQTPQSSFWQGLFGEDYTRRNARSAEEWDDFYVASYGLTKLEMNRRFVGDLPRESSFLEVGCNTGLQLQGLSRMGFGHLAGVELQIHAAGCAKELLPGARIVSGSGLALPFSDGSFDVVFTAGVLIHIAPPNLEQAFREMTRCSRHFLWGFEYFADELTEIPYRGNAGFLWKADYARLFAAARSELRLVKREIFPYASDRERGNCDAMYLLEKS